jgi:GT2 family glycosyltransferase
LSAPIIAGTTAGTFTADIMVANPDNGWADCWTHNRGARPGAHFAARLPRHWENFRAVRHDLFADVGGFEDVGYGEDMTLSPKLGVKAEQVAGARLWHHNPSTWREVWSNARWVGRGEAVRSRPAPPRYRDLGRSLRRGLRGARAIGRPRFVLFALTYDIGLLTGYRRRAKGRRRARGHAK